MTDLKQIKEDSNYPPFKDQIEVVGAEQKVPEREPGVTACQNDENLRQVWGDPRTENCDSFSG